MYQNHIGFLNIANFKDIINHYLRSNKNTKFKEIHIKGVKIFDQTSCMVYVCYVKREDEEIKRPDIEALEKYMKLHHTSNMKCDFCIVNKSCDLMIESEQQYNGNYEKITEETKAFLKQSKKEMESAMEKLRNYMQEDI